MVRIACKGCGNILVDTGKGIKNYVREEEWKVEVDDRPGKFWLRPVKVDVGVCINCGHRFSLRKLKEVVGNE